MSSFLEDGKNKIILGVGLLLVVFAVFTLMQEPEDFRDPTVISEENLQLLIEAARQRDIGPFESMLSDDVMDDSQRNKDELLKILRLLFFRHKTIYLNVLEMKSEETIQDQEVVIGLTMLMGQQAITVEKGSFEVAFQKEGSKWRVIRVKWGSGYGY
jgi:hypothetical protein